ncbi:DUF899 domain-containing protein, partial [bacterium]
ALTKEHDRVNAQRRRLPMVRVEKEYRFDTADGKKSLLALFEGRSQLIVYHFMFAPEWEKGCMGCTGFVDALGDLSDLANRDVTFLLASRAPLSRLLPTKEAHGWDVEWVSTVGDDFNLDYGVLLDPARPPVTYNYKSREELENAFGKIEKPTDLHGISVFFRKADEVFHTYSSYGRGCENLTNTYQLLDITPYGRQEDFEDSPAGWPQRPTYG